MKNRIEQLLTLSFGKTRTGVHSIYMYHTSIASFRYILLQDTPFFLALQKPRH